ncbi:MAG: hypothetical protein ACYDA8_23010, partial [Deferrisomatales bacterium]
EVWRHTGNPLFPYFNGLFHSPLVVAASFRDVRFLPTDPLDALLFPLRFSLDSSRVAEFFFRDAKLWVLYALAPVALGVASLGRRRTAPWTDAAHGRFLLAAAALAYLFWLQLFAIYRYLVPLEMLAPLLIAVALDRAPLGPRTRLAALALLLTLCQGFAQSRFDDRREWGGSWVEVHAPELEAPGESLVLMTGYEPMAYVIPAFPVQVPFLRIQGWLVGPETPDAGLHREMVRRVEAHRGPLWSLHHPAEQEQAERALGAYGLELSPAPCRAVTSNVGVPLRLCPVGRRGG